MQIKTRINAAYQEMEIHVCNHELNDQVTAIAAQIGRLVNETITGTNLHGTCLLQTKDIIRFYAEKQKVMAQNCDGVYSIKQKLYELEEMLDESHFLRISKSEIVNLYKIKQLDLNLTGTIKVIFTNGGETYVSRRNIVRFKKALGILQGSHK